MTQIYEHARRFGSIVRARRKELRLSQAEVARQSRLSVEAVDRAERQSPPISETDCRALVSALRMDADQITNLLYLIAPLRRSEERAARESIDDPESMAWALAIFQAANKLSDLELAAHLAMPADKLTDLRLLSRPDPEAAGFDARAGAAAAKVGCSAPALRQLLGTVGNPLQDPDPLADASIVRPEIQQHVLRHIIDQ
jgi:transcriptional regulator with XRE-family HTH domain